MQTIQSLRKNGFNVKTTHFRYSNDQFRQLQNVELFAGGVKVCLVKDTPLNLSDLAEILKITPQPKHEFKNPAEIFPKGGFTTIVLEKDGKKSYGHANCSLEDSFRRGTGIAIALGRAVKNWNNKIFV